MLEQKDTEFIEQVLQDRIRDMKNQIKGTEHFLGHKKRVGDTKESIKKDENIISELEDKIAYISRVINKLKHV